MKKCGFMGYLAMTLLIVGGLNWGLVGLLKLNVVEMAFGSMPMLIKGTYIAVGLAALFITFCMITKKGCCNCNNKKCD